VRMSNNFGANAHTLNRIIFRKSIFYTFFCEIRSS